jgi:hypothetical protein
MIEFLDSYKKRSDIAAPLQRPAQRGDYYPIVYAYAVFGGAPSLSCGRGPCTVRNGLIFRIF